jgi:nucleoside-diphosphate-sugar epimerase
MHRVVVTGAAGGVGQRVLQLLAADPSVDEVVALDIVAWRGDLAKVTYHRASVATADLVPLVQGATTVVHLAFAVDTEWRRRHTEATNVDGTRRLLAAMDAAGVRHIVAMSSALVYGAWPNNPVPLTEDAPLRPNPGVPLAYEKAELERTAAEWRDAHPGATVTLLRPTVTVSSTDRNGWLARALTRSTSLPITDDEPPAQFLDISDLAAAVDLARRARLDGPRNVAPHGWISGDTVRALAGGPPRLRLPERLAIRLAGMRWRWGLAETPPALLPFTVHPWVVANDRLRADGWEPTSSNEEAYVGAHQAGPWATLSPRRRQELALGAAGLAVAGAAVGAIALLRRRARRG